MTLKDKKNEKRKKNISLISKITNLSEEEIKKL